MSLSSTATALSFYCMCSCHGCSCTAGNGCSTTCTAVLLSGIGAVLNDMGGGRGARWKVPIFGPRKCSLVLREIQLCLRAFPDTLIRLVAFDNKRQVRPSSPSFLPSFLLLPVFPPLLSLPALRCRGVSCCRAVNLPKDSLNSFGLVEVLKAGRRCQRGQQ